MENWDNKNERDWYMKRKQDEMEWDMKRITSKASRESMIAIHNEQTFNPGNLKFIEVVAVLTIILGAAKLIGLY